MKKKSHKWYIYRNAKTGMELRFSQRNYFVWRDGFRLIAVVDTFVDERAVKVGGH